MHKYLQLLQFTQSKTVFNIQTMATKTLTFHPYRGILNTKCTKF